MERRNDWSPRSRRAIVRNGKHRQDRFPIATIYSENFTRRAISSGRLEREIEERILDIVKKKITECKWLRRALIRWIYICDD